MKGRILSRSSLLVPTLIGAAISVALPNTARAAAANGGQPLPWEGPLNQVLASFTGPVAKALCILAIVVIGFGFAFSEGGGRVHRGHGHQLRRDLLWLRRRRWVVRRLRLLCGR
jgi:type IV secretory pathway VirB2 component (pilin)